MAIFDPKIPVDAKISDHQLLRVAITENINPCFTTDFKANKDNTSKFPDVKTEILESFNERVKFHGERVDVLVGDIDKLKKELEEKQAALDYHLRILKLINSTTAHIESIV